MAVILSGSLTHFPLSELLPMMGKHRTGHRVRVDASLRGGCVVLVMMAMSCARSDGSRASPPVLDGGEPASALLRIARDVRYCVASFDRAVRCGARAGGDARQPPGAVFYALA